MNMPNKLLHVASLIVGAVIFAGAASAQTMEKRMLDLTGARKVIAAAVGEAQKRHTTGVVAVVDDGGNLIAVERIDNTFAAGANISIGKARTAAIFKKPTSFFEDIIKKGRTPMVALNDFTPLQGGVPVVVDGQIVGAVGVSGASSAAEDEELAKVGAAAIAPSSSSSEQTTMMAPHISDRPVTYFAHDQVDAAFAKGAVLFDSPDVNYAVHASRRTEPGLVEVHAKETDVIRVLDGEATFVTGGQPVDLKQTGPDEFRGRDVTGKFETRRLTKGDVIIVPNGVPHWFKEVSGPFTYYVVKVRCTAAGAVAAAK
jgi:glc operon protein GlcG